MSFGKATIAPICGGGGLRAGDEESAGEKFPKSIPFCLSLDEAPDIS